MSIVQKCVDYNQDYFVKKLVKANIVSDVKLYNVI